MKNERKKNISKNKEVAKSKIRKQDIETLAVGIVIFALLLMLIYSFLQSSNFSQNYIESDDYIESDRIVEKEKYYCTPGSRKVEICTLEYRPVCGWFNERIKCIRYPCAATYSNPCFACTDEKVEYWTEGECPINSK